MGKGGSGNSGSGYSSGIGKGSYSAGKGFGGSLSPGGKAGYQMPSAIPYHISNAFAGAYGRGDYGAQSNNPGIYGKGIPQGYNAPGTNTAYGVNSPQLNMNLIQYSGNNGENMRLISVSYSGNNNQDNGNYSIAKSLEIMNREGYLGKGTIDQALKALKQRGYSENGIEEKLKSDSGMPDEISKLIQMISKVAETKNKKEVCFACGKPKLFCTCLYKG